MKRFLFVFLAVFFFGVLLAVLSSDANARQLCDNGGPPKSEKRFTFTHNGDNFRPWFQIKYQTGGWCNLTGDYVWAKFIYNTQPGDQDTYPVVNQNKVAKKIEFDYLNLVDGWGSTIAVCDNTPGDDHEDGEGCDNTAWVQNPGQHGEVGKTQTVKYNCDRNGVPGEVFGAYVALRIYWDDGDISPWYFKQANQWDSPVSKCDGA